MSERSLTVSEAGLMVWSKPTQFSSTILRAFWKASSKHLPIAITSPGEEGRVDKTAIWDFQPTKGVKLPVTPI